MQRSNLANQLRLSPPRHLIWAHMRQLAAQRASATALWRSCEKRCPVMCRVETGFYHGLIIQHTRSVPKRLFGGLSVRNVTKFHRPVWQVELTKVILRFLAICQDVGLEGLSTCHWSHEATTMCWYNQSHLHSNENYTVFRKKHPLAFSFISPILMCRFHDNFNECTWGMV